MAFTSIQATGSLYTTSLGVIPTLNRFVLKSRSKIFSGSVSGKKCAIIRKPFLLAPENIVNIDLAGRDYSRGIINRVREAKA